MFIDEITLTARAGNGGDGVVRWRHEKYKPLAGPAGGDGGNGGDVYLRAVSDISVLSDYTGNPRIAAGDGEPGGKFDCDGKNGADHFIAVPVGATVTDLDRGRTYELTYAGEEVRVLRGGRGGYGNTHFKSATNRAPEEATPGTPGEHAELHVELSLVVDVGLIGLPNAGKSTLINALTNAHSRIGAYPFTTLSPKLGVLEGRTLADIPGLIAGAADGKGLGHTFLRHVTRTELLLHCVPLDTDNLKSTYYTIREELEKYGHGLPEREEWIVFTKKDLATKAQLTAATELVDETKKRAFVLSAKSGEGTDELRAALVARETRA